LQPNSSGQEIHGWIGTPLFSPPPITPVFAEFGSEYYWFLQNRDLYFNRINVPGHLRPSAKCDNITGVRKTGVPNIILTEAGLRMWQVMRTTLKVTSLLILWRIGSKIILGKIQTHTSYQ